MSTLELALTPHPLSNYLAGIGLLRLLAEQADAAVTGCWQRDQFVLGGVDEEHIVRFLVEEWVPTPVFSPWNKEGDPTQNKTTAEQLARLCASGSPRLEPYALTVGTWRTISNSTAWVDAAKHERLLLWRANAPDVALGWIDAAAVAGPDGASFPPLLGSGGNDGRFEFARLLHGELIRLLLDDRQSKHAEGWLRSLLLGIEGPALVDSTSGMYDSDAAGGPNSAPQGSAKSASNPWAIVLAFEGLIAFGSAVSSRLGFGRRQMVGAPFTIRASKLDGASAPGEDARGEFLAPLWNRPARWPELRRVFSEGRLAWREGQAVNTVDAARAVANLGADRGIDSFLRHQIAQRNGLSYVAAPAGRFSTRSVSGVGQLGDLDQWVGQARRTQSAAVQAAVRRHERAQLTVVASGGRPEAFQEALSSLVDLERSVGASVQGRESCPPFPLRRRGEPVLDAGAWLPLLDDGTSEFRIARSLASLQVRASTPGPYPSVQLALRGLGGNDRWARWAHSTEERDPRAIDAWQTRERSILEVLRWRLLEATETPARYDPPGDSGAEAALPTVGYPSGLWSSLDDVMALVYGELDIDRVVALARGLSLLGGWRDPKLRSTSPSSQAFISVDPWFAAVRLCCSAEPLTIVGASGEPERILLPSRRRWARMIPAGQLDLVGRDAVDILRRFGVTHLRQVAPNATSDRRAIAMAILVRLAPGDQPRLARSLGAAPHRQSHPAKDQP